MDWFAHSGSGPGKGDRQGLKEHLLGVAVRAAEMGRPLGLERAAYMAGLFHDLGKYDPEFQRRLEGADIRVEHSNAGARILRDITSGDDKAMAQIIGYAILGHHAGLSDRRNETDGSFDVRIGRPLKIDPVWKEEIGDDVSELVPRMMRDLPKDRAACDFAVSFMGRMLFSCLVDADYLDTEQFYASLGRVQPDRKWPALGDHPSLRCARRRLRRAQGRPRPDACRHPCPCAAGAREKPGLFTLTVPTGGGKTLALLGFALDHARLRGHSRIIYAIPFTGARIETLRGLFVEDRAARRKAPQAEGTRQRGFLTSAPPAVGGGDPARRRE